MGKGKKKERKKDKPCLIMLLLLGLLLTLSFSLTEQEMYTHLTASLTALEANPTPSNLAKIRMIIESTDYTRLHALYATPPGKK
jgi:hypothetical protein